MKNRARVLAGVLAAVLAVLLLPGCGKQQTTTIRMGIAIYRQDDTFISTVVQSLEQYAKVEEQSRNIKINLSIADGRGSQATQNEQVDRFLAQGYDIICVNLVDRTAAAVIIDKAQAANVPVIFFNREPVEEDLARWEGAYYVGLKAAVAGELQAGIVRDAWRATPNVLDRNADGVLQYVMLEGEPGHQDALLRTEYSIKALSQAGIETEKLASDTADWQRGQAAVLMGQWLEKFGNRIEVVFANNDDMALGAIDACLEAGISEEEFPFVVGVDATPPALEALQAGTLKGTVKNESEGQAETMLKLACALAEGQNPASEVSLTDGKYVWLQYATVTRENLAYYTAGAA
ncbi:MAG: galactose ABC transporter substrate-binding protein [Oscillospiraceae bacterium]